MVIEFHADPGIHLDQFRYRGATGEPGAGAGVYYHPFDSFAARVCSALYANAGVIAGDALYFLLTAAGLSSLLAASSWAFTTVKVIGIVYLVYLGLRSPFYPDNSLVDTAQPTSKGRLAFFTAFTVQLANPKLLLFLAALVPQFIDPARPAPAQFVILGSIFMLSDALVYSLLAIFAARARVLLSSPRTARLTSRISGAAMLGAAVRIGTER